MFGFFKWRSLFSGLIYGCILLTLQITCTSCHAYHSCKDLKMANKEAADGEYQMNNSLGQSYWAYCEFRNNYGYMFVSKNTKVPLDMSNIEYCKLQVLVRHIRSNHRQYDTRMGQIPDRDGVSLSIQYNKHDGYTRPQNHATFAPYIYLGFLPSKIASQKNTQGYVANGKPFTFRNCDSNPNSYLAFFFNTNNRSPTSYHNRCCYTNLMRNWIDESEAAYKYLPLHYFFQFEMHMGGCGGYAVNGYNTLVDISGAALGIRFEY